MGWWDGRAACFIVLHAGTCWSSFELLMSCLSTAMNHAFNGCLSAVCRRLMRSGRAQPWLAHWHLALPLLLARRVQAQRCAAVLGAVQYWLLACCASGP